MNSNKGKNHLRINMKKQIILILSSLYVLSAKLVLAQSTTGSTSTSTSTATSTSSTASSSSTTVSLYNPLGGSVDVPVLIGRIINIVVGMVGAIALLMFIYGGFLWLTSAGDSKRIDTGKKTLTWAILGLGIIFTARAILTLFFSKISA